MNKCVAECFSFILLDIYFKMIFVLIRKVLQHWNVIVQAQYTSLNIKKMYKSNAQSVKSIWAAPMRQAETNAANSATLDLLV